MTDIAIDGSHITITLRGMDALKAAERGCDLWAGTADGWELLTGDRRARVLNRALNKRSKVNIAMFGSTYVDPFMTPLDHPAIRKMIDETASVWER